DFEMDNKQSIPAPPLQCTSSLEMTRPPKQMLAPEDGSTPRGQTDRPARILVVEDDFLVSMQIEAVLIEEGFDLIATATTADEAVKLTNSHRPELIVMDIRLAGKRDGIDAALEIFQEHGIRCIFATAHYDQHSRLRAEPSNPLGWLQKPYE